MAHEQYSKEQCGESRSEEFAKLFTSHQHQLFGYILALVQNLADAEDVLQQTGLIIWRKFGEFPVGGEFEPWARRIALYEARNFLKTKRRSRIRFSDEFLDAVADARAARADMHQSRLEALAACMDKLSGADRELIELCYAETGSIKQAAEKIDRPVGGVYKSLERIRNALMKCINRTLAGEGRR